MALWGGRFSEDTAKNVTEFSESVSYDKRLYKFDVLGSKAHSAMLASCGIIPQETANLITKELDVIEKRIDDGDFEFKAELEDIHMHIESALIEALGDEGARVHTARSRNDQVALDVRMYVKSEITELIAGIKDFQKALLSQCERNGDAILPGFTHLQHAQPVLFAHHLLAYVEMLGRDVERLESCYTRVDYLPLGSGALAGSTLPIDREFVREKLGFSKITRNSMDTVADRDYMIELLNALATFGIHVSRLSEDVILWCSQEFNFVELSDAFCTGSSLMPQKKNPDIAEISRGKSARIIGSLMTMLTLCKGLPLTYNRDLQEDKEPLFDAIDTAKKILSVFPQMMLEMEVNRENMLEAASDPALMATDVAEKLVELNVPFRNAHHRVGAFVKWCKDNNKELNEVSLKEMQITIPEANEEFLTLFSPVSSVEKRQCFGGTAPEQVKEQIEFWNNFLTD
ncbi:argininosuccinate lyase [Lentisphaerota bacterium WC36G]|nr:argininosuccinate lyase [Lentisphaerae bacterium WC36]